MLVNFPCRILVEKSVEGKINDVLLELNLGKKCAVFCDDTARKIIGGRIYGIISERFKTEITKPESAEKAYLEALAKKIARFDFSLAIGGGRTIDIAKYSSHLAGKPWIAFPTILSHDGVVSSRASVESNGMKISVAAGEPAAIIADLETIKKAPYRYLASGCGDLISNISAVNDWQIAEKAGKEKYSTLIAELSLLPAKAAMNRIKEIKSKSYHGLEAVLWGLVCSGFAMNLHGSSRPCSGSEHNFSHAIEKLLGDKNKALHGEQVALGTIISLYLQKGNWKKTRNAIKRFSLPVTAKQLGISDETAIKALATAKNVRERYTILNKYKLTERASGKILERLHII